MHENPRVSLDPGEVSINYAWSTYTKLEAHKSENRKSGSWVRVKSTRRKNVYREKLYNIPTGFITKLPL